MTPKPKPCQRGKLSAEATGMLWYGFGSGVFCGLCYDCGIYRISDRRFLGGRHSLVRAPIPSTQKG